MCPRLWSSVREEHVQLHTYETASEAGTKLALQFDFHNRRRPYSSLDQQVPDDVYFNHLPPRLVAWPAARPPKKPEKLSEWVEPLLNGTSLPVPMVLSGLKDLKMVLLRGLGAGALRELR